MSFRLYYRSVTISRSTPLQLSHRYENRSVSKARYSCMLFATSKRSSEKEMFLHLSVILFTGGSLSSGSLSRGVSVQGNLCPGDLSSGGFSVQEVSVQASLCPGGTVQGVSVQGGLCPGLVSVQGDPRMVKSGRYASYWNAC